MTFSPKDADAWYERNKHKLGPHNDDPVLLAIAEHGLKRDRVFEFGCANGWRLSVLQRNGSADVWGSELSPAACRDADPRIKMNIEPAIASCDIVIMGFCLYLIQPGSLLYWAHYADSILADGGHLVIHDFYSEHPFARVYEHNPTLLSRHMDFSKLWLSHPHYSMVHRTIYPDETSVAILRKSSKDAFPIETNPQTS